MITELKTDITIEQICRGFVYNELEGKGLFGLSGKLTIQPEYQRNYMSRHRYDADITELKTYFTSVIDWVSSVFSDVESEMRGLEWGRLFETYHNNP